MSAPGVQANASPLKRALVAIEKLQARVEELEGARREPIAIVGLSCRFPGGADSPEAFWRLLRDGVDAVAEIPPDRWDADALYDPDPDAPGKMATRWGAFLPRVDTFDPRLFGITPREAAGMDPQQRLLLELSWEALEHAGIAPDGLAGTPTGVFVGLVNDDYRLLALQRGVLDELGPYFASGTANSVAAGRISYVLGFQGPAITVDTACSSSLVAVHLAVQSLRAGECRMALAGGANVVLSPEMTIALSKYRMMAADGRCKAFDARADGFVRGEGGAVLVLKRLSDAQAAGDRILAVIRGSAVNQDGPSSGLTAPNGPAQEAVLRAALADAGVAADAVGYVEAHGTGTSLGDPIEVQALDAVLGEGRDRERPLLIGSVKTNIGHLESAAGVAGLVKAVLALRHGEIPASLHFREPNPLIAWDRMRVRVVAQRTAWERGESGRRIAGVSSFGFSGTNAHVVVEEWRAGEEAERAMSGAGAPVERAASGAGESVEQAVSGATAPVKLEESGADRPVQVLTLSAREEAALGELASRYAQHLEAHAELRLEDVAHTANVGRARLPHRLAVLASSTAEAAERLAAYATGATAPGVITGRAPHDDPPEVVFLFTGQGSQYAGMGRELYESSPVFRSALDRCAAVLESELEVPLLEVLYPEPGGRGEGLLERTEYTQPALFALEWSLVELWRSWGVEPALVLGHSVGEYVAACVAGVLEVEEALRLVAVRGRLMGSLPAGGVMVAVFAPEARVREVVERVGGGEVSVAAVNAPESVVVSGAEEAVERVVGELVSGGVGVQRLRVSHAFHSALMDPVVGEFERVASGVRYGEARIGVVSNVTGEVVGSEVLGRAGYWARQLREAVRYADGVKALWARGQRVFVEVGPSATLVGLGRACVPDAEQGVWLSSLRPGRGEWETLLGSVAELYVRGVEVDWAGVDRPYRRRRVELPTYPFQRQRYWLPEGRGAAPAVRAGAEAHPLLGRRLRSPLKEVQYEAELSAERFGFIADHRVRGTAILPATAFMEIALAAAAEHFGAAAVCGGIRITDIVLAAPLAFPPGERVPVQTIITPETDSSASFRILSSGGDGGEWRLHASGAIAVVTEMHPVPAQTRQPAEPAELDRIRERCRDDVGSERHYADLSARGLDFGPALRGVVSISRRDGEALAHVRLPDGLAAEASAFHVHPALLDACFQAVAAAIPGEAAGGDAFLPLNVESYRLAARPAAEIWSHVTVTRARSPHTLVAHVRVLDERGGPVAEVRGLMLRRLVGAPGDAAADGLRGWLHEVRWRRSAWPAREELPSAAEFAADPRMASYGELFPLLEDLAADFVEEACVRLGWRFAAGDVLTADGLAAAWGVVQRHHRLLGRLMEILTERGVLEPTGPAHTEWTVRRAPREAGADARWRELLERHPAFEAQLRLVGECGRHLAGVLTGGVDPLALLFPNGSAELAERLYRESPQSAAINELIGRAARAALAHRQGGAPVRAIEIGAGTGSATAAVLRALAGSVAEYVFTDVSPAFVARARERSADRDGLRFAVLDIERDPVAQGFAAGYDLVVASNVLHATADVGRALAHARALLAPDGVLLLAESIRAERWIDITFGLTDGWWRFTDRDLRPAYPLLPPERWRALLAASGFAEAAVLPGPDGIAGQAVIVARAAEREAPPGSWLLIADRGGIAEAAADLLRDGGHRCVVVPPDPSGSEQGGLERWLAEATSAADRPLRGVLYLAAADAAEPAPGESFEPALRAAAGGLVRLVQELGRAGVTPPGLWVVTRGAQPVGDAASGLALAQAPLWGLAKVIRAEHPELRCVSVDLDPAGTAVEQALALVAELRRGDGEDHVGVRGGERYVARLARSDAPAEAAGPDGVDGAAAPAAAPEPAAVALEASPDGVLEALAWRPARRRAPGPGEVEIRVSASGLNFRDVMNALGMRADPEPLGSECSGRIVAVGPGVTGFEPGDDVVAIASGGFASFAAARAALTARRPAALDSVTAAGVPIAYLTAHYALNHVARIAAGERVLIHAAAGGVGLAAVRLAQRAGAEVFATAGSPEKREFLRRLGVAHVMDSRTLDFAGQVLEATGGRGVDVVLNSLAGEFIPRSLDALAEDGRFLEIGKRGIWTAEQVAAVKPRARYEVIDLSPALVENPDSLGPLFQEIVAAVDAGELPALPVTSFPAERVSDAFRYMAQARHIGKVIVARDGDAVRDGGAGRPAPDRAAVRPDATYLVVGGTAGLGLETARWLVERGARNLVLMARREPSADARGVIQAMEEQGARVLVVQGDVSRADDVRRVLDAIRASMPPLRGIIQSAGVLEDRALLRQDWDSFARVLAPKVDGSWHLHCLTADEDLDFFVLYSSVAALMGPAGQGAHAAANAFLDALAHHRRAAGRPALSIGWGVWTEIGSAAARGVAEREAGKGVGAISPAEGLRALETVMRADAPQVAVMPMDWRRFLADHAPLWLSELRDGGARTDALARGDGGAASCGATDAKVGSPGAEHQAAAQDGGLAARLAAAPRDRRRDLLLAFVHEQALRVIGGGSGTIDPRQPLNELGVDSLMAVELRNLLGKGLGVPAALPATLVFDHPTIDALTDYIAREVLALDGAAPPRPVVPQPAGMIEEIEQLSDEEVERYFASGEDR